MMDQWTNAAMWYIIGRETPMRCDVVTKSMKIKRASLKRVPRNAAV